MQNNKTCVKRKSTGIFGLPMIHGNTFKGKRPLQIVMLAGMLLLSLTTNAALVTQDWKSHGDGALTYDDNSGLWWLDLTETAGMSYRQVTAQLGLNGAFEGWRYATVTEGRDIYAQFGLTLDADLQPIEDFRAAIATMNSYFGDLFPSTSYADTHSGSWSISGTEWPDYPEWHYQFTAYTYRSGETPILNLGEDYAAHLDMSWEYSGSLLVTKENPASLAAVPEPQTFALVSFGLAAFGIVGMRRRKQHHLVPA
jgi:hypothetical protein